MPLSVGLLGNRDGPAVEIDVTPAESERLADPRAEANGGANDFPSGRVCGLYETVQLIASELLLLRLVLLLAGSLIEVSRGDDVLAREAEKPRWRLA